MPGADSATSADRRKTFALGLGCQKGGTTWLYHYLKELPEFIAGYRKEYHVLALDNPDERYMRNRVLQLAEQAVAAAAAGEKAEAAVVHRLSMYLDQRLYYEYFAGLLNSHPDAALTADMTPSNGMIPARRIARVQTELASRNVRTAAVFLLRDPVDRVWSQLRMQYDRDPGKFSSGPEEELRERYARHAYARLTDYEGIVGKIDSVFAPEDRCFAFYEQLTEEPTLRSVCATLRVEFRPPRAPEQRRNASPRFAGLPADLEARMVEHYAGVYRFVARRFDVDLGALWPRSRHVL